MDEFTVKSLLKKMKQHETTMSAMMGVIAVGLGIYAISPYFTKLKTQSQPSMMITPSPIPMVETLPTSTDTTSLPVKYAVKKGDSTWRIAEAFYGSSDFVENIERENNLKANQQLEEGLVLTVPKLPDAPRPKVVEINGETTTYKTLPTDTLWKLAQKFYNDGYKWTKIYEANKSLIKDPNNLEKDLTLTIPE